MVEFSFWVEDKPITRDYLETTRFNLQSEFNIIKNPFCGSLNLRQQGKRLIVYMDIMPLYPDVSLFGWIGVLGVGYFMGWTYWMVFPAFIGLTGFFHTRFFYYFMLMLGLRKKGYQGPIKYLFGKSEGV